MSKYPDINREIRIANERPYDGVSGTPEQSGLVLNLFESSRMRLMMWAYEFEYAMDRDSETPLLDASTECYLACERGEELKQRPNRRIYVSEKWLAAHPENQISLPVPVTIPDCAKILVKIKRGDKLELISELLGISYYGQDTYGLIKAIDSSGPRQSRDKSRLEALIRRVFVRISNLYHRAATDKEVWNELKEELGPGEGKGYFHTVVFEKKNGKEYMKWWRSSDMNGKPLQLARNSLQPYTKIERGKWELRSFLED